MQSKFKFKTGDLVKVGDTGLSMFPFENPYTPWCPDGKVGVVLGYDEHEYVKLIVEGISCGPISQEALEKVQ